MRKSALSNWTSGAALLLALLALASCGGNTAAPDAANLQVTAAEVQTGTPERSMEIDLPTALAEIDALATPGDVDSAVFAELKSELARLLAEPRAPQDGIAIRQGAALGALTDENAPEQRNLRVDHAAGKLSWLYRINGDYDQNGEVNQADLVPLARKLGLTAGKYNGDRFNFASVESVVDGNDDGEINISDVSPISVNFHRQAEMFEVYGTEQLSAYPYDMSKPSFEPMMIVGAEALHANFTKQSYYEIALGEQQYSYYWVRRLDGEKPGKSSMVAGSGSVLSQDSPSIPPYRQIATGLEYSVADNSIIWNFVFCGDSTRDGKVTVRDITPTGKFQNRSGFEFSSVNFDNVTGYYDADVDRSGVVDICDVAALAFCFGYEYEGYRLYYSASSLELPDGYWGDQGSEEIASFEMIASEVERIYTDTMYQPFANTMQLPFTPASGSFLYLRPYSGNELGPVCEFVQVP